MASDTGGCGFVGSRWLGKEVAGAMTVSVSSGFHVRILNGFELSATGRAVLIKAGPQRLIAFLTLYDRPHPRSYVAGILWPNVASDRASANLRASIWRLPPQCRPLIELADGYIRLADGVTVDYLDAKALAHR